MYSYTLIDTDVYICIYVYIDMIDMYISIYDKHTYAYILI